MSGFFVYREPEPRRWTVDDLTFGMISRIPALTDDTVERIGPGLIRVTMANGQTFIITVAEDTR